MPEASWVLNAVELLSPAEPGSRFDDSRRRFRVAYTGTTKEACLVEVLQPFRPHAATLDELTSQAESRLLMACS